MNDKAKTKSNIGNVYIYHWLGVKYYYVKPKPMLPTSFTRTYIYIYGPAVPFCKYCSYKPVGIEFYERFGTGICVGTFLRNSIGSYNASV